MPKKRLLTLDSRQDICAQIRATRTVGLTVRSLLAGHFKQDREIRQRWETVLYEMAQIGREIANRDATGLGGRGGQR